MGKKAKRLTTGLLRKKGVPRVLVKNVLDFAGSVKQKKEKSILKSREDIENEYERF